MIYMYLTSRQWYIGKIYFNSLHQKYFGRYLFAPYLDEGTRGYLLGAIILIEILSIPLLPFIFLLYGIDYVKDSIAQKIWNELLNLGTIDEDPSTEAHEESILQHIANIIIEIFDDDHDAITGIEGAASLLFDDKESKYEDHDNHAWVDDIFFNNPLAAGVNIIVEQVLTPLFYIPRWIMTIAYTSPWMYVQYYFYGKFACVSSGSQMTT